MKHTDIDIDIANRDQLLECIESRDASIINNDTIKKHNVGIYLQNIPTFMNTNMSSFDYREVGDYGFFKIDVLNNTVYENVKSEEHLDYLIAKEPDWNLLQRDDIVPELFQIHRYGELLKKWQPKSVSQLAMFIAMIRPAKKHLLECNSWEEVERDIWNYPKSKDKHYFKKSHSIAYAVVIKVQLNLIVDDK